MCVLGVSEIIQVYYLIPLTSVISLLADISHLHFMSWCTFWECVHILCVNVYEVS